MAIAVLLTAPAVIADESADLQRAQKLAWDKQFSAAERVYRDVLERSPQSREAALGLARVLLWEGRYRDARRRFIALGDREGAATAAYWQGDYRTAAREFRSLPGNSFARESLAAIEQNARGTDRVAATWLDDDQPFQALRVAGSSSFFSDALTRWDAEAGWASLAAPRLDDRRTTPFATLANETVLPWQRLTIRSSAGIQRYPDRSMRFIGELSGRWRVWKATTLSATVARRELLATTTSLASHPFVTTRSIQWLRSLDRSWIAGAELGSHRYFDSNRGRYAQGYLLLPLRWSAAPAALYAGASAAFRDTAGDRFYLEAVSGSRTAAGGFSFAYRGAYTPYWTPRHQREVRAIALITFAHLKLQLETGTAHDTVAGFGPDSGSTPLPSGIFSFDFRRTSHPGRAAITFDHKLTPRYGFQVTAERSTTAFYTANAIHASLVRQR